MKLRDYQVELINKINESNDNRNCIQLSTGGGKTIIFSHLANNHFGNVLILVNRTELIEQTARNINRSISLITAKTKKIGSGKVKIGMVESVYNRIQKGVFSLDNIDLIIADEIHNLQFIKVFENYKGRLLGFTATPVTMKKESYYKCRYCGTKKTGICCGKETKKYTKNISLNQWYGKLITGIKITELIEKNYLTIDHNFICDNQNLNKLKTDSSGNYTSKSENEVFNNLASTENLLENYINHSKGLKTMVFNTNIESNNEAVKMFLNKGYNVRGFDSKSKEKRKEIVEWFRRTPDAVLMSVGVFTTGFDVDDVQSIILNKATKSLSLYHQMVGRGGRITDKIYKPFFKVIDLGGNVSRFGKWSEPVDWHTIYNDDTEKKTQIRDTEDFIVCVGCEAMINDYDCEYCGQKKPVKKLKSVIKIAKEINKLPPPKAKHILNYALKNELTINDAKNLTANYFVDMFIFYETKKKSFLNNIDYIKSSIKRFSLPIYFELHNSELKGNRRRTIDDFQNKILNKITKHYENRI